MFFSSWQQQQQQKQSSTEPHRLRKNLPKHTFQIFQKSFSGSNFSVRERNCQKQRIVTTECKKNKKEREKERNYTIDYLGTAKIDRKHPLIYLYVERLILTLLLSCRGSRYKLIHFKLHGFILAMTFAIILKFTAFPGTRNNLPFPFFPKSHGAKSKQP